MTRSTSEQLEGARERVKDGILYSDYHFREYKPLDLFQTTVDIRLNITAESAVPQGTVYSDSSILTTNDETQASWNRTVILQESMIAADHLFAMLVRDPGYGTEWIDNFPLCASRGLNYDTLLTTGLSYKQLVSYMDVQESTKANVLKN